MAVTEAGSSRRNRVFMPLGRSPLSTEIWPAVLLYQLAGDPEADARAGIRLGAEECVEDLGLVGKVDAVAVVLDQDDDSGAPPEGLEAERQAGVAIAVAVGAAGGERVDSVGDEVGEDLTELVLEDLNSEVRGVEALDGDVKQLAAAAKMPRTPLRTAVTSTGARTAVVRTKVRVRRVMLERRASSSSARAR